MSALCGESGRVLFDCVPHHARGRAHVYVRETDTAHLCAVVKVWCHLVCSLRGTTFDWVSYSGEPSVRSDVRLGSVQSTRRTQLCSVNLKNTRAEEYHQKLKTIKYESPPEGVPVSTRRRHCALDVCVARSYINPAGTHGVRAGGYAISGPPYP